NLEEGPLGYIIEFLDISSIQNLARSCTHFHQIIENTQFWSSLIHRDCIWEAVRKLDQHQLRIIDLKKLYRTTRRSIRPASTMSVIHMGDTYWKWNTTTEGSTFGKCAKLHSVCWLHVVSHTDLPQGSWIARWRVLFEERFFLESLSFDIF